MSDFNLSGLMESLAAGSAAIKRVPELELTVNQLQMDKERGLDTIAAREITIQNLKSQIDELNAKLRSVEVERDDAAFRTLELEDRFGKVLVAFQLIGKECDDMVRVINPPKPEPEPVAETVTQQSEPTTEPQAKPEPTSEPATATPLPNVSYTGEPQPPVDEHGNFILPKQEPEPKPQPYAGKFYRDIPRYIPYAEWIDGGGTDENYYSWEKSAPSAQ